MIIFGGGMIVIELMIFAVLIGVGCFDASYGDWLVSDSGCK